MMIQSGAAKTVPRNLGSDSFPRGVGRSSRTILAFNPTDEKRDVWTRTMGCEAKALERALLDEALSIVAHALAVNSTSQSLCRTGAMSP